MICNTKIGWSKGQEVTDRLLVKFKSFYHIYLPRKIKMKENIQKYDREETVLPCTSSIFCSLVKSKPALSILFSRTARTVSDPSIWYVKEKGRNMHESKSKVEVGCLSSSPSTFIFVILLLSSSLYFLMGGLAQGTEKKKRSLVTSKIETWKAWTF